MARARKSVQSKLEKSLDIELSTPLKDDSLQNGSFLYGINICNKYRKSQELSQYLKQLHEDLGRRDQEIDNTPEGFKDTVQYLVSAKLIDNSDKKIRILVGCCLVDVFRIYAPETPYKDALMLRIFDVLINLIRSLPVVTANSEDEEHIIYIIQSLARVKSCVIPVIMAQRGVESALDTVRSLFEALIDSVRSDQDEVFRLCMEIIHSCIVEYEGIPDEWVDTLLMALLLPKKSENPVGYKLVSESLRSVAELPVVQQCFAQLVSDVLVNPSNGRETEVEEHIYSVIYELHLVSPQLLIGIIPEITTLLKVEADEIRLNIVRLLGKVYCSEAPDYTQQFEKEFREFCQRINDRTSRIRGEMVEFIVTLIRGRPQLTFYLEELICSKLRDPEEEIRLHTLTKLLEFAQNSILSLSQQTYNEICERAKDKKTEIRKVALLGLSKLFFRHVSSNLPKISAFGGKEINNEAFGIGEDVLKRLETVPSIILRSWGYPDFPTKHLILHLLQEFLLPKSVNSSAHEEPASSMSEEDILSEVRATALILLFRSMKDEIDRKSLGAILAFKVRVAEELHRFLELKNRKSLSSQEISFSSTSSSTDDSERISEMKLSLHNLSTLIPLVDKKLTIFDRLISSKDKYIVKLLEGCVNATTTIKSALKQREELQKRLDSKSTLGEYMTVVYDFAGHHLFDTEVVRALLSSMTGPKICYSYVMEVAQILSFAAKFSSKAFGGAIALFKSWLDLSLPSKTDKGLQKQMKEEIFERFYSATIAASRWFAEGSLKGEFVDSLIHTSQLIAEPFICLKIGEILGHLAFINFEANHSKSHSYSAVVKLLQTLCQKKNLQVNNSRLIQNLCLLSALIRVPNVAYERAESIKITSNAIREAIAPQLANLIQFLFDRLFVEPEVSVEAKSVGLRVAANVICCEDDCVRIEGISSSQGNDSSIALQHLPRLTKLIFECISKDGKIFAGEEIEDPSDQEQLLEACAIDGILLARVNDFSSSIAVEQWQELAWVIVQSDREVKKQLLSHLSATIQIHPVHLKFLALPCLFATDSDLSELAQRSLIFAIKRLRRTHEDVNLKLAEEKDSTIRDRLKLYALYTTPEMILPYLLYLLSYHPDFPSSMIIETDEDKRKVKDMVKCVQMLISSLQQTLRNETSNLPFLFKQLNTIMQRYIDRFDPDNIGVHFVTRLTLKMLTDQVKTSDNVQLFPGEILPPSDLFKESEVGKVQKLLDRVAAQQGSVSVDADIVIERALSAAQKSKKTGGAGFGSPSSRQVAVKSSPSENDSKRKKKEKSKAEAKQMQEEVPLRSLPKRGAKVAASYAEPDEDESEVERWNEDAAKKPQKRMQEKKQKEEEDFDPFLPMNLSGSSLGKRKLSANSKDRESEVALQKMKKRSNSDDWGQGDDVSDGFISKAKRRD